MRARRAVFGVIAVVGGGLVVGASAFGADSPTVPAGGPIQVIVQPSAEQGAGKILITGAIGDFGTTESANASGKPDPGGSYSKVILRRGTFLANLTQINALANSAQPVFNSATCSAEFSVTGPVPLLGGTGLYARIAGTANITETFGFIARRYEDGPKKGQCNMSQNVAPLAQLGVISGTGTVSFS